MKFSIVIPTYNRRDTLEQVLPSIAKQDYPVDDFEILLSDSGSTDGTLDMEQTSGIPNLRVITGENRGRSGARNRGVVEAKGEIILFTDADIIATPNLLSQHAKYHEKYGNCAVIGCEVRVDTIEEYERVKGQTENLRTLHPPTKKRLTWLYFLTGNASIRREELIKAGLFDESFTGYGHEDLELGYRIQKAGIPIYYNKDAVNYHWHPVEFEEECERRFLAGISTVRFYNKHKDPQIKMNLGWNPFNMLWQSLLKKDGTVVRWFKNNSKTSNFCKEAAYQYYWVSGIKEGMKTL
ncbi:MAG: glycosyltransferase family 2 protein [Firmicutes bacterium]|nr:glycosyltransferase family 2 protein [Bacillota bacterium]